MDLTTAALLEKLIESKTTYIDTKEASFGYYGDINPFGASIQTNNPPIQKNISPTVKRKSKKEKSKAEIEEESLINIKELADYYASIEFEKEYPTKTILHESELFNNLLNKHLEIINSYKINNNE